MTSNSRRSKSLYLAPFRVLWEDRERLFCRTRVDEGSPDQPTHLLAIVSPGRGQLVSVDRLAHEYALKGDLDAAWAVRPLDLVHQHDRIVLVLEDPGGELLQSLLGTPMEPLTFVQVAEGLAAAVRGMHERGLVHRQIHPRNVMVHVSTGQVRLTGFGLAAPSTNEREAPLSSELVTSALAYMAPEQTGRMNRSVDARSDLYSLGISFYEMLTGSVPLTASDPMELIHFHVARLPVEPRDRLGTIPATLSRLVMKLLAKAPEDRYQTAAGLEHDLRRCRDALDTVARIDEFPLAERDVPNRLPLSERLYGRSRELSALRGALDRVAAGGVPELVLVSGYAGSGKSSLVNELHEGLLPARGLFAWGKFDRYRTDIPYWTLAQGFRRLIQQILSKTDSELGFWREAIQDAVGPNGLLIVGLIPELELVIGTQPAVTEVPPYDAQRRFRMVLKRFVRVFCRPQQPLTLFLDDLQWFDISTIELLEQLLTTGEVQHLLVIGTYRDNEVGVTHPLRRNLDAMRRSGAPVTDVVVAPLSYPEINQLVCDLLRCAPARASELARLLHEKTGGSPYFAIQFLHALEDEALLTFDHRRAQWTWDLGGIRAKGYTDNVVELLVTKLSRLPAPTQDALRRLACLGSEADITTLATVCRASEEEIHRDLREAVGARLVSRKHGTYVFSHDRVQEAAYSLIPEDERAKTHLAIGRLLWAHTPPEEVASSVFDIVGQLNRGAQLVDSPHERERIARLNLAAGKRAKHAAAYSSALVYFAAGRGLLTEDDWVLQHALAFDLELGRAECEFLIGDSREAEGRLLMLKGYADKLAEQAAVTCLLVDLYTVLVRSESAVEVGLEFLGRNGYALAPQPTDAQLRQEYEGIWRQLGSHAIEDLLELPLMNDPGICATMAVFGKIVVSALFRYPMLHQLLVAHMVRLSMEHGNISASCVGYAFFGRILANDLGDSSAALRFGQLSLDLVDKRGLDAFKARVYLIFGSGISPWGLHLRHGLSFLRRAAAEAENIGDLPYIGLCRSNIVGNLLASGERLPDIDRIALEGLDTARKTGSGIVAAYILGQLRLIRSLRGLACDFGSFDSDDFHADTFERHLNENPDLAIALCLYWNRRLQEFVIGGDYVSALQAMQRSQGLLKVTAPNIEKAEYHFYAALARLGSVEVPVAARNEEEASHIEAARAHHLQLRAWAAQCPENFEHRAALVGAELARLDGRELDAERLYERAIHGARENGFIQNEALSCESAARFYARRGFDDIADMYLTRASEAYLRWGADGEARRLEALDRPVAPVKSGDRTRSLITPDQRLDAAAVVKASQALSSEILLPRLVERLMTIALQSAGADRGLLILPHRDEYRVEAEARTEGDGVLLHIGTSAGLAAAETIVRYVMRAQETVILIDAAKRNQFSEDPYFSGGRARSVLCLPLKRQGGLAGMLYLENTLAPNVFTPDRATLLDLLASQAAISLENARLYADLKEREARVRRLFNANIIGIFTWNLSGKIIDANDAFLRIVGYAIEDVSSGGLSWKDLMPSDRDPADGSIMETLLATSIVQPFEGEYVRKDGAQVPVLIGAALFEGIPSEGVAFVVDLSDRKRAELFARESERQSRDVQIQLEHANRVATMGHLSASIAHELNQPLTGVVLNARTAMLWLERETPNVPEARTALARIVRDGNRASEVFGRIRSLVKKLPPQQGDVAINDLILEVVALTQAEATRNGVAIRTDLQAELPLVRGDRVQLQQVTLNLIMNAIEAIVDGDSAQRDILVRSAESESGQLHVQVGDSGPGMDPENLERIFDAFYTTKPAGLGMGLSICRSIVESHAGKLWATPNIDGPGTTFSFSIPLGGESPG